ncbi:unnamed protein product [Parnassius apollo]|uniref:(apollo) hypothetical protein n=1 Tax=Parnassius apollo TaxID=110799 RepID=A0A8S3W078_PARAO|nr:unnamed protein product [Parnassius apollo]
MRTTGRLDKEKLNQPVHRRSVKADRVRHADTKHSRVRLDSYTSTAHVCTIAQILPLFILRRKRYTHKSVSDSDRNIKYVSRNEPSLSGAQEPNHFHCNPARRSARLSQPVGLAQWVRAGVRRSARQLKSATVTYRHPLATRHRHDPAAAGNGDLLRHHSCRGPCGRPDCPGRRPLGRTTHHRHPRLLVSDAGKFLHVISKIESKYLRFRQTIFRASVTINIVNRAKQAEIKLNRQQ